MRTHRVMTNVVHTGLQAHSSVLWFTQCNSLHPDLTVVLRAHSPQAHSAIMKLIQACSLYNNAPNATTSPRLSKQPTQEPPFLRCLIDIPDPNQPIRCLDLDLVTLPGILF